MNKHKNKLSSSLQAICVIPLLIFGIVIILYSSCAFTQALHQQVEEELRNMVNSVMTMIDVVYPGDYRLDNDSPSQFFKENRDLLPAMALLDRIKSETGLEVTVFRYDTRYLTSICDKDGNRLTGTKATSDVISDVLMGKTPHFYTHTVINGSTYFSYYTPLFNREGQAVGILFVGKPAAEVKGSLYAAIIPMVVTNVVFLAVSIICAYLFSRNITRGLQSLREFLSNVSTGNLNAVLDKKLLCRNDELEEIANSAVYMQRSLRKLVERDTLTDLYNRRYCDNKLKQTLNKSLCTGSSFAVSIGDIDFFKNINDTYGHECGDEVLIKIAALFKEHMEQKGFAARWGGEEFLLVYENTSEEKALSDLEKLMDSIRSLVTEYEGNQIQVTMTFGLALNISSDLKQLLRQADDRLYQGKTTGRNKIVS